MQTATCLEITCTIVIINNIKRKKYFFLDQGKWSSLKENIAKNRENYVERFREQFCASYAGYLEKIDGEKTIIVS